MSCLRPPPGLSLAGILILVLSGCDGTRPDATPPKAVTDLAVAAVSESTVTLTWTAPENDGQNLKVEQYDLRYTQGSLPQDWESSTRVSYPERPQPPGGNETATVSDLIREQRYAFALRSADRSGNWSPLSNVIQGQPADDEPPGAIEDLRAEVVSHTTVRLSWTATGDDGEEGVAGAYQVRYALGAITEESWDEASPLAVSLEPSPPGTPESLELTELVPATDYWFAVRAVDDGGNLSPLGGAVNAPTPRVPRTWVVAVDGSGDEETVQGAIDGAIKGDTVLVKPGRYYEDIDFLGKDLVVRSAEGPEVTILDGSREDSSVVIFQRGETRAAVLAGFTITGGRGTLEGTDFHEGGGIWCAGASPTIRGNHIVDNHVEDRFGWGGGLLVWSHREPPLIEGNLIDGNSSRSNGGGMGVYSAAEIRRNVFRGNQSGADGGGIHIYLSIDSPGAVEVMGNEFWENIAEDHGGAIEAYHGQGGGPFRIEDNLFVRNEAYNAEGNPSLENGTGGAISARGIRGWIRGNTLVGNIGTGWRQCTGGSILLDGLNRGELRVQNNIIAGSYGCGVDCRGENPPFPPMLTNNLFWSNQPLDVSDTSSCTSDWETLNQFGDPVFCDSASGDFRVAASSSALGGEEVIGAYPNPGCGPMTGTQPFYWGLAPVRHR